MTQVYIIAGIMILIIMPICVVFIRQTITKRKKEQMRLHRALDQRAKDLTQMINAFPPQFLPQELSVFLYRCLVDTYEQLSKLSPDNPEYLEQFKIHTAQMEAIMRVPKERSDVSLNSTSQINEIRQYLNHLGRFIQKWMQRGNISSKQYSGYKDILKKLITQLMVDNYSISAKQAVQMGKEKLAVHYYMLAKNLLTKEGIIASKKDRLEKINQRLSELERKLEMQEEAEGKSAKEEKAVKAASNSDDKECKGFDEDDDWKKKNVYD